jgi:hypothetical protein
MYELGETSLYWDDVLASVEEGHAGPWQAFPPLVLLYRSLSFMAIIMFVGEICARWQPFLQPRGVPATITAAVVLAGLAIIFCDWGFGQLLLRYSGALPEEAA